MLSASHQATGRTQVDYDDMIQGARLCASREARLRDSMFEDRGQGRWVRPERDDLFSRCCWPYTLIELRDEFGRVRDTTMLVWLDGYEEHPDYYAALAEFQGELATCSCDEEEGDDDDCPKHGGIEDEDPFAGTYGETREDRLYREDNRANDHPEFDHT